MKEKIESNKSITLNGKELSKPLSQINSDDEHTMFCLLKALYEAYKHISNADTSKLDLIFKLQEDLYDRFSIKQQCVFLITIDTTLQDTFYSINLVYGNSNISNTMYMTSKMEDAESYLRYLYRKYKEVYSKQFGEFFIYFWLTSKDKENFGQYLIPDIDNNSIIDGDMKDISLIDFLTMEISK